MVEQIGCRTRALGDPIAVFQGGGPCLPAPGPMKLKLGESEESVDLAIGKGIEPARIEALQVLPFPGDPIGGSEGAQSAGRPPVAATMRGWPGCVANAGRIADEVGETPVRILHVSHKAKPAASHVERGG